MKQRIDLLTLLCVLGSSSIALGQTPSPGETPAPPAQEPATESPPPPPMEAAPSEAAPEAAPEGAPSEAAPAFGEAGAEAEAEAEVEVAPAPVANEGDQIIVTGSRIKRSTSFATSSSVQVIDRKQLEYSGATNLADVVQYLTVNQGSGYSGEGAIPNGTASINLRGLGVGATLILLNGRRLGPSGGGIEQHYGDISTIPMAAVERIEILKGGGSAIYGADAVGGVVNIITRKNWDGARLEGDAQGTTKLDWGQYTASAAFGATSERGRVLAAVSYYTRDILTGADRSFTSRYSISQQGNPGSYIVGTAVMADPDCNKAPTSKVVKSATGAQFCSFDFHQWQGLISKLERANAFASAEYDLTNHTTLFGELLVSRTRGTGIQSPSYAVPPPFPVVPANHVDNPFHQDVQFIGRVLGAAQGPSRNSVDEDTFRVVTGLKGDLEGVGADTIFESWEWELVASMSQSRFTSQITDTLRAPLQMALNSCSDPADLSRCFNPFYSAVDGTGTPNSQAVLDSFTSYSQNITDHALGTYNAGMSGSLFELPGGDVGIAFGAELRHEWRQSQEDHDSNQQGFGFLVGNTDAKASRDVYSGYGELRWPFYDGIELQTAVRVEHYTDIDKTTPSPFAGLTLIPAEIAGRDNVAPAFRRLQIRGGVTWAFRSPTIYQSYPGFAVVPTLFPSTPLPLFIPVQAFGNPKLEPETALVETGGVQWQIVDEFGFTAEFWNYDYKHRIRVENAQTAYSNFAAGRSDPHVLVDPASGQIERIVVKNVNYPGDVVTNGFDLGGMFTLTGATFGGDKNDWGSFQLGSIGTYTMNYKFPREEAANRVVPNTMPAKTLQPLHCSGDSCQAAGSRNYKVFTPAGLPLPRWRLNFPVTYAVEGHAASVIGHYISGVEDDNNVLPDGSLGRIKPWFTLDLQYAYTIKDWIGKELTVRVGAYNLFDAIPPSANSTNGFDALLHDPRGRMVYAKLISQF